MLSGDFFYIKKLDQDNGKIDALLEINAAHKIFEGHFPGQPVVPGVCMMQMVKEIMESALSKQTRLVSADNLKFLTVLDPTQNDRVHAEVKYSIDDKGRIKLAATLGGESVVYFKMNGVFKYEGVNCLNHDLG